MADWWQSDAYKRRLDAGEVVTPGLIDWGGLINAFNAPYNERVGRLPVGPTPPPGNKGHVTPIYGVPFAGREDLKSNRGGAFPTEAVTAQEQFYPRRGPMTAAEHLAFRDTTGIPRFGTGPDGYRLVADAPGYGAQGVATGPKVPAVANANKGLAQVPLGVPMYSGSRDTVGQRAMAADVLSRANFSPSAPVHQLNVDVPPDEGQMYADSMGIPVRSKSGKVYTPKVAGSAVMPSGAVAPRFGGARAPAASPQRSGGLFGMLFGGGSGGGLFGGARAPTATGLVPHVGAAQTASGPAPTYTTTPFQEDRFQTTTGAQMPASMNNSRWTTGY